MTDRFSTSLGSRAADQTLQGMGGSVLAGLCFAVGAELGRHLMAFAADRLGTE